MKKCHTELRRSATTIKNVTPATEPGSEPCDGGYKATVTAHLAGVLSYASMKHTSKPTPRKPEWLQKRAIPDGEGSSVSALMDDNRLNTVCRSARCPNKGECFENGVATFMILGETCSRNCGFCAVSPGSPSPPDNDEPFRVAEAAKKLSLKHVVITSVTRDDLPDGGAGRFAKTVNAIRAELPNATVEVLTPDFAGDKGSIELVLNSQPDIFNHNIETVPTLYKKVRPQALFERSLEVLRYAKEVSPSKITKSGLMLGFGETFDEVIKVMDDLFCAGVDIVTVGQYLQPTKNNLPVTEYIGPETFSRIKDVGEKIGFKAVFAGPYVRSSYHAGEVFRKVRGL